jgi:uncharacterized protein YbjT (DUF2867 family)
MKIVILGGTGLIGARLVVLLERTRHQVVSASRRTGVNSFTAEGLASALEGADVVVDVSNSSYTDEAGAAEFFEVSTLNLLHYGAAAGVRHHVALSVVGTERLARSEGGYFRAKALQERLVRESGRPYTIVHATQFFEFVRSIADRGTASGVTRVADVMIRPMAADDVAHAALGIALGRPHERVVEFGGPEVASLEEFVWRDLLRDDDPRQVEADPLARYFGAEIGEDELLPGADATLTATRFADWVARRRAAR